MTTTTIDRIRPTKYDRIGASRVPEVLPTCQIRFTTLPAPKRQLEEAGVDVIRIITGDAKVGRDGRRRHNVVGFIVDADWEEKLANRVDEWRQALARMVAAADEHDPYADTMSERDDPYSRALHALWRAQLGSDAAKRFRDYRPTLEGGPNPRDTVRLWMVRGSYAADAYGRKDEALREAVRLLADTDLTWGWATDPARVGRRYSEVLYVDLPTGQVSFHASSRLPNCPDYPGEWDGVPGASTRRIEAAVRAVLGLDPTTTTTTTKN